MLINVYRCCIAFNKMRPTFKEHSIVFQPWGHLEMTFANHQKEEKKSYLARAGMFRDLQGAFFSSPLFRTWSHRGLNAKAHSWWSPQGFCGRKSQDFIKQREKLALKGQNMLFRHSDGNTNRPIQFLVGSWFVALLNVRHCVLKVHGMFALQRIISTLRNG